MRVFKAPVIVKKVETLSDRGSKLTIYTRELQPEELTLLFVLRGVESWLLLSPSDSLTAADVPAEPPTVNASEKTPSQRLRGVLYVLWEQSGQSMPFEMFYRIKVESVIDSFKEKLEA